MNENGIKILVLLALFSNMDGTGKIGHCESSDVVEVVTQCAKRDTIFLKCVKRGNQGTIQQCRCIQENINMQSCIANCLADAYAILCERRWKPRTSKYLPVTNVRQALRGIDGIHLINLPRRADRLSRFLHANEFTSEDLSLISAFDGKELTWNDKIEKLFSNNTFHSRRGLIGQALSHLQIWSHIADSVDEFHLILEDDVVFDAGFQDLWNTAMHHAFPIDSQIVFLGGVLPNNRDAYISGDVVKRISPYFVEHENNIFFSHVSTYHNHNDGPSIQKKSKAFHYKPIAYILSSKGAKDLVKHVQKRGFSHPTAMLLMDMMRKWDFVCATFPLMAHEENSNMAFIGGIDSDIEFDTLPIASVPFPLHYSQSNSAPKIMSEGIKSPPKSKSPLQQHDHQEYRPRHKSQSPTSQTEKHTEIEETGQHSSKDWPKSECDHLQQKSYSTTTIPLPRNAIRDKNKPVSATTPPFSSGSQVTSEGGTNNIATITVENHGITPQESTRISSASNIQVPKTNMGSSKKATPPQINRSVSPNDSNYDDTTLSLSSAIVPFGAWKIPVVVISLPGSKDRLSSFRTIAIAARLKFHVHTATDGRYLIPEELRQKRLLSHGMRDELKGTIAQALSHILLIQQLSESSHRAALVFEDDAIFNPTIIIALSQMLEMAPDNWDIISLACNPDTCGNSTWVSDWFYVPSIEKRAASIVRDLLPVGGSIAVAFSSDAFVEKYQLFCLDPRLVLQQELRPERRVRDYEEPA